MRCFYHHDREAVGTCKSCGKGVCPECAVDLGKGLACRGHCEEDARAVIELIERNIKLSATIAGRLQGNQRVLSSASIFNLVTGGVMLAWGIRDGMSLLVVLGVCFLGYGLFGLFRWRVTSKTPKTPGL